MGRKITEDNSFISDDLEDFIDTLSSDDFKEEKPLESPQKTNSIKKEKPLEPPQKTKTIKKVKPLEPPQRKGEDSKNNKPQNELPNLLQGKEQPGKVSQKREKSKTARADSVTDSSQKSFGHGKSKNRFVSRAGLKLAGAVEAFDYDFTDKTVLDIGSSTGGFTEFALEHGAKKVISVEKGTNQMDPQLRIDTRIDLREKTDIFMVTHRALGDVDVILADVSFVSLTRILSYAKSELASRSHRTDFLVMLKPQFEARPNQLLKGIVKNERMRRSIIQDFESWCRRRGFVIKARRDNEIPGKNGNLERFYWLILSR